MGSALAGRIVRESRPGRGLVSIAQTEAAKALSWKFLARPRPFGGNIMDLSPRGAAPSHQAARETRGYALVSHLFSLTDGGLCYGGYAQVFFGKSPGG